MTIQKVQIFRKYSYSLLNWLMFSFFIPWGNFLIMATGTIYYLFEHTFRITFIIFYGIILYGFLQGWYQHSIQTIFVSLWHSWLAEDGIYGMRFFERFYIFKTSRLLAKWVDIEKVELRTYRFNRSMGSLLIFLKNGKKFRISFFRVLPYNHKYYKLEEFKQGKDEGISLELAGIIAWKIGINKFYNLPEEEGVTSTGNRENMISVEGIQRVVRRLERGDIEFEGEEKIFG